MNYEVVYPEFCNESFCKYFPNSDDQNSIKYTIEFYAKKDRWPASYECLAFPNRNFYISLLYPTRILYEKVEEPKKIIIWHVSRKE